MLVKISSLLRCLVMLAAYSSYRCFLFSNSWRMQPMVRREGPLHSCHLLIQVFVVLTGKLEKVPLLYY